MPNVTRSGPQLHTVHYSTVPVSITVNTPVCLKVLNWLSVLKLLALRFCPPVSCRSLHLFACETRGDQVVNDFPAPPGPPVSVFGPASVPLSWLPFQLSATAALPPSRKHLYVASLGIISYCFLGVILHHCMRILTIKRYLKDFISLEILLTLQGNHR